MTKTKIWPLRGPEQADGTERWLGFLQKSDRAAALRATRADPAAWDALRPVAVISRDRALGRYYPVRGSDADCAALAAATRS